MDLINKTINNASKLKKLTTKSKQIHGMSFFRCSVLLVGRFCPLGRRAKYGDADRAGPVLGAVLAVWVPHAAPSTPDGRRHHYHVADSDRLYHPARRAQPTGQHGPDKLCPCRSHGHLRDGGQYRQLHCAGGGGAGVHRADGAEAPEAG